MENEQLLQNYVERIEALQRDVDSLKSDIREVFAKAKQEGFSAKGIREVLKYRKMNPADRREFEWEREKYLSMMGLKGE